MAYTPTKRLPKKTVLAPEAMISTDDSAGPTHGVQAKLNVKPMTKATKGFMRLAAQVEMHPMLTLQEIGVKET